MKQPFTLLMVLIISALQAQEAEWFELGTTWTYNWNGVADPAQEDLTYTYAVTELTEYLGHPCSKIEAEGGSFGCLLSSPPYYMYFSDDTVFYATGEMDEFAIGYVLSLGAEWEYSVLNDVDEEEVLNVSVLDVYSTPIDGQEIATYEIEYNHLSGVVGLVEIFPAQRIVWEYIGDPDMFIVPFGVSPVCDVEINVELRCFTSPSLNYQSQNFSSCTLGLNETKETPQSFFPNPSVGTIAWNEPIDQLSIYDTSGKLVLQKQTKNSERSLSVEDLPGGFYTLVFEMNDTFFSQRLIVQ